MSPLIVPTIGRKIWLWLSGADRMAYEQQRANGIEHPGLQPMDASICYTINNHLISVTAAGASGFIEAHTSVQLIQAGEPWDQHTGKHCQWMPFQVTAASKPEPAPAPFAPIPIDERAGLRELTSHRVNPANDLITIDVLDEPGAGGACHRYRLRWPGDSGLLIEFQNGAILNVGVNGVTHEALLAVLIDRLECFQLGAFANDYNAIALAHLRSAQGTLLDRTRSRMARGVEGTNTL